MDVLGGISRALELRWDVLIRIAASAAGLAAVVGLFIGQTPLEAIAAVLSWLGLDDAGTAAIGAQQWITERSNVLKNVGLVAMIIGVATTSYRSRGAALAVLGMSLCAACSDPRPIWVLLVLVVLWAASRAYSEFRWRRHSELFGGPHEWFGTVLVQIPTAILYLPVAPLTWIVNPRPFRI